MDWNDIIGHNDVIHILQNMLTKGRVPHAFLFSGYKGLGKHTVGRIFAQGILCMGTLNPCNICYSCSLFKAKSHPDYLELAPSGTTIKIEQIRELIHFTSLKPAVSSRRVVVIDDAETMTDEAANSLLKILEEPPEPLVFILISSQKDKLLSTIASRCVSISFYPLPVNDISKVLQGGDSSSAELAAKFSEGCLGAARCFLETGELEYRQYACDILDFAADKHSFPIDAVERYDKLDGNQTLLVIKFLLYLWRDILVIKNDSTSDLITNYDIRSKLEDYARIWTVNNILDVYRATRTAQHALLLKANMRLTLEELFITYCDTLGR